MKITDQLDPDRLKLSKDEIVKFCDTVISEWNQNKKENWKYIAGMQLMKNGIKLTPEAVLLKIWRKILSWFNDLLYRNAIEIMREEKNGWYKLYDSLKSDAIGDKKR